MRKLSKIFVLLINLSIFMADANGQDIHYSQYYASPLTLNPSLTGKFNGNYRLSAIYRTQYFGVAAVNNLYQTPSASADFSLLKDQLKGSALGLGLLLLNDQARIVDHSESENYGTFTTLKALGSLAFHQKLSRNNKFQLSAGFQGGVVQKGLKNDFRFELGYLDANGNPNYDEILNEFVYGENTAFTDFQTFSNSQNTLYPDFNAGILFNGQPTDWMTFYFGGSYFHILPPTENFIQQTAGVSTLTTLPARYVGHGGFEFEVNNKILVIPGVLYQSQANADELNFGSTFGYQISQDTISDKSAAVFLGLWHRWDEAMIVKTGFEVNNFQLNFAWDIITGSLKEGARRQPMSFEVGITYIGGWSVPKEDVYLFNPRF